MKKIALKFIVFLMLITGGTNAQNLIAVQNGENPTFYTTLNIAIDQAQNSDTIYISAGGHTLFNPIDKELHLVGVGYNADSSNASGITIINSIILKKGADYGSLEGLYISGPIQFGYSDSTDYDVVGFDIRRCYVYGGINFINSLRPNYSTNISIIECHLIGNGNHSITGGPSGVIWVQNCKISGMINGVEQSVFQNNIFFYYEQWYPNLALSGTSCTIMNNVFYDNGFMSGLNCTFLNNIGIWGNGVYNGSYGTNAYGSGNVTEPWDSTFINPNNGNYHLRSTSIGNNAGTDGTDIGIYGGLFPWKDGSIPYNPHVQYKSISGTTDNEGNLNVNIKVEAQDR